MRFLRLLKPGLPTAALFSLLALAACAKNSSPAEAAKPAEEKHAERLGVWTEDYAAAVKQAQAENKKILLDFTGSDWCENCFRLDDGVFSKPAFADYAKTHYVLVMVDFPLKKKLSEALTDQNTQLMGKYQVIGLPTVVLLDAQEHQLASIVGYGGQTPEKFLDALEHPAPPAPVNKDTAAPMPPTATVR